MEFLFSIVSPLLVGLTAILVSAALKLPTKPAKLISIFAIAFAEIVLIGEILGSTYALSYRALWLLLQLVILLAAAVIWRRSGKPGLHFHFILSRAELLASAREYPALWLLGLSVFFTYVVGACLILYVPPNNNDGLAYHLARVGYWLQFDSLFPWETLNFRQTTFPLNAEIGVLWTILVRGNDQLAGFVQWVSALVSAIAIFALGRQLGFSRTQSAFPAIIYLTLSQIYLQSTTVQNDLVISAFFVSALYLLLVGVRVRHYGALLLSGICIGLCVGTKSTAIFILPGLACAACLLLLQDFRGRFKLFIMWGGTCLASLLIWGVYIYVVNLLAFGHVLGPEEYWGRISNTTDVVDDVEVAYSRSDLLVINSPRYFTQMLDFSSLGAMGQDFTQAKYNLFNRIFENTLTGEAWMQGHWDWSTSQSVLWGPHEDTAWFGLLGALLFLPGIGYGFYLCVKRRDAVPLCIALIFIIFWLLHSAAQPYTPAKGRYYVLPITAGAVLMIWPMISNRFIWRILRLGFTCLAVLTSINNLLFNEHKPLVGSQSVINQQRAHKQGYNMDMDVFLNALETFVSKDAKIIMIGDEPTIEFPVFGANLTRYIVPVVMDRDGGDSFESLRTRAPVFFIGRQQTHIPNRRADYILIDSDILRETELDTTGFEQIAFGVNVFVYRALDTIQLEAEELRYEFDGTTPGSGWYSPIFSEDGLTYQWMSSPASTLGAARLSTANDYAVRLHVARHLDEEIIESLTLLGNDLPLPIFRLPGNVFWGIIPAAVIGSGNGLLQLTLKTSRIISPYELGLSDDRRPMGIAVDWLIVEPMMLDTSIRAEFDGQYPTNGFQPPNFGASDFQWSGAAESSITLPLKVEGDLRLELLIRSELTVGSIENLSLMVDDRSVESTMKYTPEGVLFTALIPEFPNDDYLVTVSFKTIEPTSPNALDSTSPDTRSLGFAPDWLTIEPLR